MATPGIPILNVIRIASVAASNASLFATNLINGSLQGMSTLRIFFSGPASIFTAVYSDGTNTHETDLNNGAAATGSAAGWTVMPLPGSSILLSGVTTATGGLNFKYRNNTSSTATYTLFLDECRGEMI